jgi:hypothetical protein
VSDYRRGLSGRAIMKMADATIGWVWSTRGESRGLGSPPCCLR